jgi:hypothetical protein
MTRRQWGDLSGRQRAALLAVGGVQWLLAARAWWDLAHRSPAQVNGRRGMWAAVIGINWIGPLAWYRWGRVGAAR